MLLSHLLKLFKKIEMVDCDYTMYFFNASRKILPKVI